MSINIYKDGQLKSVAGSGLMDAELSLTSTNGVQNKVVTAAINELNNDLRTRTQYTQLDWYWSTTKTITFTIDTRTSFGSVIIYGERGNKGFMYLLYAFGTNEITPIKENGDIQISSTFSNDQCTVTLTTTSNYGSLIWVEIIGGKLVD